MKSFTDVYKIVYS